MIDIAPRFKWGGKLNVLECCRDAYRTLGVNADLTMVRTHLKEKFGINTLPSTVSNARRDVQNELSRRTTQQVQAAANGNARKAPVTTATIPAANGHSKTKVTKMEAVRRIMDEFGDITPIDMQGHIKRRFGLDMSTDHISTYKGDIKRKAKGMKKNTTPVENPVTKPVEPVQVQQPAPPAVMAQPMKEDARTPVEVLEIQPRTASDEQESKNGDLVLDTVSMTKALIQMLGRDRLKKLIDVL